jgi:hypothetical protein
VNEPAEQIQEPAAEPVKPAAEPVKPAPEPYESPKHFAVIFTSELKENEPAVLRPIRKTKATKAVMLSDLVAKNIATLKDSTRPIRVYIVSDSKLEAELRPYMAVA